MQNYPGCDSEEFKVHYLFGGTNCVVSLSKAIYSRFSTGSSQEDSNDPIRLKKNLNWDVKHKANLKNICVSPYPTLFYHYGSGGRKLIFLN